MTWRGLVILDDSMGTKYSNKYPCKRQERENAWEEKGQYGHLGKGWSDGTTNQKHLQPPQAAKGEAWISPWSLQREHGSGITSTSAQWCWFLTSGSQNVERIHTSVVWSHKAASRKTRTEFFHVHLSKPAIIMLSIPASLTHKTSHKLDRKGHCPWNCGNSDPSPERDKCPSYWLRRGYL